MIIKEGEYYKKAEQRASADSHSSLNGSHTATSPVIRRPLAIK